MLMCAPTGAGKTNIAMLAIMHELGTMHRDEGGVLQLADFKIVYVAPMKALVQEVVRTVEPPRARTASWCASSRATSS
jgi:pre-mRNA-splicing helicase BRR2